MVVLFDRARSFGRDAHGAKIPGKSSLSRKQNKPEDPQGINNKTDFGAMEFDLAACTRSLYNKTSPLM
ncbi:hypothetical protein E5288_WYG022201 [Bos mutus]|uniref:Uncharacterized protein n=1 Tax=Bos mutus TaxID=72004 RepID=A0A6B0RHJ7_9CETA|nr:hypothetical protein [Bos mutus]